MAHVEALTARDGGTLAYAIQRSCEIKASVVAEDEREGGVRAHLNFGHTFGHAIERLQGYGEWLHGEAVAAGMVIASQISVLGALSMLRLLKNSSLQSRGGFACRGAVIPVCLGSAQAMSSDKKVSSGKIRYILLQGLGEAVVTEHVTTDDIVSALSA
ncbi:MAG: hypothetical protein CM15mP74_15620 [Halieaceae bacterium]|nr:MAG: hypothetical protein CM15mP74_15620 [Halieaceae bacterium]